MSREKQIEEMARTICPNIYGHYGCDSCDLYDNECCLPFNIARALTDKGYRKQSEWISVEDRLPEEPMSCIVYTDNGDIFDTFYNRGFEAKFVTHWMYRPDPPNVKGE